MKIEMTLTEGIRFGCGSCDDFRWKHNHDGICASKKHPWRKGSLNLTKEEDEKRSIAGDLTEKKWGNHCRNQILIKCKSDGLDCLVWKKDGKEAWWWRKKESDADKKKKGVLAEPV